jgi:hypothetical protein
VVPEEKMHVVQVAIGIPLRQRYQFVRKNHLRGLHADIGTVKIPDFVTVVFPDVPTDIDLDVVVIVGIGKDELASFFQLPVFSEDFGDFPIDIRRVREQIQIDIRGKSVQAVQKITGRPSFESQMARETALENLPQYGEEDGSVFFFIEHGHG